VTVIDAATMRPFALNDPDEALGADLLEQRKMNEKHLGEKLLAALQSVPGVLVNVSVELDASRRSTQTQDYGKPTIKMEETTETSTDSGSGPAESGVNANVGVALGGAGERTSSRTEKTHAEYNPALTTKVESVEHAPFTLKRATASIGIPRSFLVGIHRARFGDVEDQSTLDADNEFVAIRDSEINRVRSAAMNILMTDDPTDVDVTVFYDFAPESSEFNTFPGGGATMMASADGGAGGYVARYGMQAGVVGLALISFVLMTRLVRKSSAAVKAILPPGSARGAAGVQRRGAQRAGRSGGQGQRERRIAGRPGGGRRDAALQPDRRADLEHGRRGSRDRGGTDPALGGSRRLKGLSGDGDGDSHPG
jgi:flagellar biosynthesis/type III secretory pathway M-ring protein FliF/YscJ